MIPVRQYIVERGTGKGDHWLKIEAHDLKEAEKLLTRKRYNYRAEKTAMMVATVTFYNRNDVVNASNELMKNGILVTDRSETK